MLLKAKKTMERLKLFQMKRGVSEESCAIQVFNFFLLSLRFPFFFICFCDI